MVHLGISDHSLVFMTRKAGYLRTSTHKTNETRYLKFLNQADFLAHFNQVEWEGITVRDDPVILWQQWKEHYFVVHYWLINMHLKGGKESRVKNLLGLPITYYVACARDFLKRTHAKTNDPVASLKFNKARNDVNNFIRVTKRKYLSENLNAKVKKQRKYRRILYELQ